MNRSGFTLIEMAIVVTILIVLSVTVIPLLFVGMRRSQLHACAEQLASHIRYARSLAMAQQATKHFQVRIPYWGGTEYSYRVCAVLCSGTPNPFEKDPLDETKNLYVIFDVPPAGEKIRAGCEAITIDMADFDVSSGCYFDANGIPNKGFPLSVPGYVRLKNKNETDVTKMITVYVAQSGAIFVGN